MKTDKTICATLSRKTGMDIADYPRDAGRPSPVSEDVLSVSRYKNTIGLLAALLLMLAACAGEGDEVFNNLESNQDPLVQEPGGENTLDEMPGTGADSEAVFEEASGNEAIEVTEEILQEPVAACPTPTTLAAYEPCCEASDGYCLPMDTVPPGLQSDLDTCGEAGACVPGVVLNSLSESGSYAPEACESIGGKEGVCLSVCIPAVRDVMALLPQGICAAGERCTPCIDPLSGEETGACGSAPLTCGGDDSEVVDENAESTGDTGDTGEHESATPAPVFSCDTPPDEAIVDVEAFNPCCDGAHCVPKDLVPEEEHEMLAGCDGDTGFCVPDPMVASGGFFVPQTCESIGGLEGRCLSTCLPNVGAQAANLPVDICASNERCSPCCDPFTGESTGACDRGCDTGPESGVCEAPIYASCCNGLGHCIEPELIPEEKSGNVKKCKGENKDMVCVPDAMQDPNYAGEPCLGTGLMSSYQGVCLPDCLKILLKFTLDDANCADHHKCVPCVGPLGKPTGAPGCPQ